jgi:hypothetical protein
VKEVKGKDEEAELWRERNPFFIKNDGIETP